MDGIYQKSSMVELVRFVANAASIKTLAVFKVERKLLLYPGEKIPVTCMAVTSRVRRDPSS